MTQLRAGSATDIGRVRQSQQDSILVDGDKVLFGVADGMGGHRGGEVASQVAVETVQAAFDQARLDALVHAVEAANDAVVRRADGDPDLRGMGTTLCAMALVHEEDEDRIAIVNVGDSRFYLLKHNGTVVEQISEDHSLVETLVRQGQLSEDDAVNHPHRNILTRALGIDSHVMVDRWELLPFTGDRYLMCSDGLFNEVEEPQIADILRTVEDPTAAAEQLVALANEGGGRDNISVVVVDVVDDKGRRAAADEAMGRITMEIHGNEAVTDSVDAVVAEAAVAAAGSSAPPPLVPPAGASVDAGAAPDVAGGVALAEAPAAPDARQAPVPGAAPEQVVVGPGAPAGVVTEAAGVHAAPAPRSRFTWRVALFVVVLLGLFFAVGYAFVYFANNTYYVGLEGQSVVVYQGRPGGVLWIKPVVVERTDLTLDQVPDARRAQLTAGQDEPTVDDARRYIANLRTEAAESNGGTVPGSTPSSSTTRAPGGAGSGGASSTTSSTASLGGLFGGPGTTG
ncbi:MAG: Stp1/IreP family PP2C-type Ser/Thr phosphatase [Acidimicrobiales bacterium]